MIVSTPIVVSGPIQLPEGHPTWAATVPECFLARARLTPTAQAFTEFNGREWRTHDWQQVVQDVAAWAKRLRAAGLSPGEHCVTICENRYEWLLIDLAIQFVGAVHVPLSPLLPGKQLVEIIEHCQARLIVASSSIQADKLTPLDRSSADRLIVLNTLPTRESCTDTGAPVDFAVAETGCSLAEPDSLISILYTSGTTGSPKGVMLTHENVMSNVRDKLSVLALGEHDVRLAWLPWTHIFGRVCDLYTGIAAGCHTVISQGRDFLFEELKQFRPTYLNGVPYFYEKCYRVLAARGELTLPGALGQLLGGRLRLANCGGAPLADHVFDYFRENGIELVCGYGLTETSPVLTSNRPKAWRRGSVGQPVPSVEICLAEDGEVLARGPNVMRGYFRDIGQTEEVLRDGWFHTGDLGRIDNDGFLYIVGRKKELIVLNTGVKVAPLALEHRVLAQSPLYHQCVVFGDRRDYLVALIVLDIREARRCWPDGNWEPDSLIIADERIREQVERDLQQALADRVPYEHIKKFAVMSQPFSVDDGLATAKQSLRREAIWLRYAAVIDDLYCPL